VDQSNFTTGKPELGPSAYRTVNIGSYRPLSVELFSPPPIWLRRIRKQLTIWDAELRRISLERRSPPEPEVSGLLAFKRTLFRRPS